MPSAPASLSISVLLIESEKSLVLKLQDLLIGNFQTALDLAIAGSLREGMTHLCTHPVALILMNLSIPDYKGIDAVCAGTHDVLSLTDTLAVTFHLAVECAMIRAPQPAMQAGLSAPDQARTGSATIPKLVHDLNNTIMSINGFVDLLLNRFSAEEPARVCSEQIQRAGTRAAALLKSLALCPDIAPSVMPAGDTDSACTTRPAPLLSSN